MWKLGKIHKIGELVAAIAVVTSLLFVGIEIQQNNQIQSQTATRSLVRDWSDAIAAYMEFLTRMAVGLLERQSELVELIESAEL
jgi:hypothetical protein